MPRGVGQARGVKGPRAVEAAGSDETLPFLLTRAMGPRGSNGPMGIQEDPRGGGKEGNPRALWEGDGTIWIYSEAIPNGKLS